FLVNHDLVIYNFRKEIVERLIEDGYEVHISSPYGNKIESLISMGAKYHDIKINRHGKNILDEVMIRRNYYKLFRNIKPDIILGFTIKPNLHGAIVASKLDIPFIANITGLGNAMMRDGILQNVLKYAYRKAFKNVHTVLFQNKSNLKFFKENKLFKGECKLLPGS